MSGLGIWVNVAEEGERFVATCPQVPGAMGSGSTREEAIDDIIQALALRLGLSEDMVRLGIEIW